LKDVPTASPDFGRRGSLDAVLKAEPVELRQGARRREERSRRSGDGTTDLEGNQ
jgi:hypothetical protein